MTLYDLGPLNVLTSSRLLRAQPSSGAAFIVAIAPLSFLLRHAGSYSPPPFLAPTGFAALFSCCSLVPACLCLLSSGYPGQGQTFSCRSDSPHSRLSVLRIWTLYSLASDFRTLIRYQMFIVESLVSLRMSSPPVDIVSPPQASI